MPLSLQIEKNSVDTKSSLSSYYFSNILLQHLQKYYDHHYEELIILCIGTDRSTGDSLGPLIGYKLCNVLKRYSNVHVLGTLDEPVHAKNLDEKISLIKNIYNKPFIIAIDACLGKLERVGYITVSKGPLKPGAGVNKNLPEVGDIHITGVVNLGGFMEYIILQNTRLSIVMKMADVVATSFNTSIWRFFNGKEKENVD